MTYSNNPNQYPPPPYPQQNFQQQQQYQQPQQAQQPYPQAQAPAPQYQPQYSQGVQAPVVHKVDETAMREQIEKDKQEAIDRRNKSGPFPTSVRLLGPKGETDWKEVFVGYSATKHVHICPPWVAGKKPMVEWPYHYYKSFQHPKGASIGCPGPERCRVCQAAAVALDNPDAGVQKRAKDWGKQKRKWKYNVIDLDAGFQAHVQRDGTVRPFVLEAGVTLKDEINEVFDAVGFTLLYPDSARPVRIKKEKTGPNPFDIEWRALQLDVKPLPQEFWPILSNLWDLEVLCTMPTEEEMLKVVAELGLGPQPAAYNPQAMPPHANPYQAPPPAPATYAPQQYAPQALPPLAPPPMAPPPMQSSQMAPTQYAPQVGAPSAPPTVAPQTAPTSDDELAALQAQLKG